MFMFLPPPPRTETECARLVVPVGTFQVTNLGVQARLQSPLSRLSGVYPWALVPVGFAMMRILVLGDNRGELITKLVARFHITDAELDAIDSEIGVVWKHPDYREIVATNPWCQSLEQIKSWCSSLARQCPYQSTAWDLAQIRRMSDDQLEQYVMRQLR